MNCLLLFHSVLANSINICNPLDEQSELLMNVPRDAGLLAGVLTLIYGFSIVGIFVSMMAGFWRPTSSALNPLVLAALDMIVYIFLGVQILRDRREFLVSVVFWTIFGVVLATFAPSYRNAALNLLSFLIVFFSTFQYVSVTKADATVAKSLGLLSGVLSLGQGVYVTIALVFANILLFKGWIIPVPPFSEALLAPPLTVAAITVVVYLVYGVGMMRYKKEFFVLAILWTILESALAVADSSFVNSHFNIVSILILAFATYYYYSETKT